MPALVSRSTAVRYFTDGTGCENLKNQVPDGNSVGQMQLRGARYSGAAIQALLKRIAVHRKEFE